MMPCLNKKLESNMILSLSLALFCKSVSRSSPSLTVLVYVLLLSLWDFSIFVEDYFQLKGNFASGQNNSKHYD